MSDLISRQVAIDTLIKWMRPICINNLGEVVESDDMVFIRNILKSLPPAQPEVIRCKECKHRTSYWGNCRLWEEKYHQSVFVDDNDFCSRAERRTNGVDC